jgi:hypothetical protein
MGSARFLPLQVAAVCYRKCDASFEFLLVNTTSGDRWIFPKGATARRLSHSQAPDGGPSLPYDAVVVAPEKVYAGSLEVDPENIALHLHCGCLEADLMMQEDFQMNSMKEKCEERFPMPTPKPAYSKKN